VLRLHGLPADPDPEAWYPLARWVSVLNQVAADHGPLALFTAGQRVVELAPWPPDLRSLPQALAVLQATLRRSVRGPLPGGYHLEELDPQSWRIVCLTPVPAAFDGGLLASPTRRFRTPDGSLAYVSPEPTPAGSPTALKWFRLSPELK